MYGFWLQEFKKVCGFHYQKRAVFGAVDTYMLTIIDIPTIDKRPRPHVDSINYKVKFKTKHILLVP
jgi:hypothetical protein